MRFLFLAVLAITAMKVALASICPVITDEAYYHVWGKFPDWGYFDHPPGVGLLQALAPVLIRAGLPDTLLVWRLPEIALSTALLAAQWMLMVSSGLQAPRALLVGLILAGANLAALINGFIATPDSVMILGWTLALWQAVLALRGRESRWRWLLVGAAVGLGLLSKYTTVLIGPVLLLGLWQSDRAALATRWPYLGALVALLVFSPHVAWNLRNDWIPVRFQLRHGLSMSHKKYINSDLPMTFEAAARSPEDFLGAFFEPPPSAAAAVAKPKAKAKPAPLVKSLRSLAEFLAVFVALWGFLWLTATTTLRRPRKSLHSTRPAAAPDGDTPGNSAFLPAKAVVLDPHARNLMWHATWFPLAFFGAIALGGKVEGNWAAMAAVSAAVLAAPFGARRLHLVVAGGVLNALILLLIAAHGRWGLLPLDPRTDRMRRESAGFAELAAHVATLAPPVFAHSYQIAAMVRFYDRHSRIGQWEGITRPSEFVRRAGIISYQRRDIELAGGFWIVSSNQRPNGISRFTADRATQVSVCEIGARAEIVSIAAAQADVPPAAGYLGCSRPLQRWYLVHYVADEKFLATAIRGQLLPPM